MASAPLTSAPAGERAYADVRDRILSGELAGGDLISEGEVAARLGISRTPVREAFLRLQAEGFMKLYPKRGALIVPIARSEARDVIEARELVEAHAARVVTGDAARTTALVAQLRQNLELQRSTVRDGDLGAYAAADADFHSTIVQAGGNELIIRFYESLRARQVRMIATSVPGAVAESVIAQHEALLAAIDARDADRFAALLHDHLSEVHEVLIR
ncbi:GntR family transcriptional regulator [Gryllotalpicola ginsengisoli]|uniref:GntR family transcriptional regulator n=1 Tax=Gryllotalpicola ginsengisoli TaxID=444608 RepID=UPI0003B7B631|nr:GntR family transcriptional regulator [Gryllotalpicola ginsengisoli]